MNIEALNDVFVNKSQKNVALNAESRKEAASENNYDWLNEYSALINGNTQYSKTQSDDPSQLDLSAQGGGWRSDSFSFLTNTKFSTNSKYSDLKSFQVDTGETYTTARDNLLKDLKSQLTEAKNTLSKLEAEQTACQKNSKSSFMAYALQGGKINESVISAFKSQANSYDSKIKMQQVTISNLEARIQKVEGNA